ncbi:hypothetical protein Droror1_Dr00010439 [Drosera rotundifolia]
MAIPTSCLPLLFRRKTFRFQTAKVSDEPKKQKEMNQSLMKKSSSSRTGNFVLFMELRKKILTFRDLFDISPLNGSVPIHELVIATAEDLHRMYPELIPCNPTSKTKERNAHQGLICFYDVLRCIGESWITDKKKRDKFKHINTGTSPLKELVEVVVAMLECINKAARERFDTTDEDEPKQDSYSSRSMSIERKSIDYNLDRTFLCSSPHTPTSVLPESPRYGEYGSLAYSPPCLWELRVQALEKLVPADLKRLALNMMPHLTSLDHSPRSQKTTMVEGPKADTEQREKDAEIKASSVTEESKPNLRKSDSMKQVNEVGSKSAEQATSEEETPMNIEMEVDETVQATTINSGSKEQSSEEIQPTSSASPVPTPTTAAPAPMTTKNDMFVSVDEASLDRALSPPCPIQPSSLAFPSHEVLPQAAPTPPSITVVLPVLPPIRTVAPIRCAPPPPPPLPSTATPTPSQAPLAPPSPPPPPSTATPTPSQAPLAPSPPPPPPPPPTKITTPSKVPLVQLPPPPPPPIASRPPPPIASRPPPPIASPPIASRLPPPIASCPPPSPPLPGRSPPTSALSVAGPPAPKLLNVGPPAPPPPTGAAHPPPPPPMMTSKGSLPVPPPPMAMRGGAAAPPPPPGAGRSLRAKVTTKLKRSSHMGNLYRLLKGKVEGSCLTNKSSQGKKGVGSNSGGGKQSMADALAEMTKRSAYFQQIEDDVQKHGQTIKELHGAINSFQTKDMDELLKFQKHVESRLEVLTDESQVLARFEGFPIKKLETLRTAAALYIKLDGIVTDLHNWKIESPLGQLLDRVEKYFNKIKGEMDALERTKNEEAKRFQSHNIHFDFHVLVKIKEAMVDVSSSCMELALMEKREAKAASNDQTWSKAGGKQKICAKMLWRAFQFAFKVYSFAGGQDDRADLLTRELAREIETDPMQE